MRHSDFGPRDAGRRDFVKIAGAGLAAGGALLYGAPEATAGPASETEKLARIASTTWPARSLFKRRPGAGPASDEDAAMKKKYGELTMLDFARFTKDTWPGVTHMDLWSSLFGDVTDDSMFVALTATRGERTRTFYEFDPSTTSGKRWLDRLADTNAAAGVKCHHVSNNAPRDISDLDPEKRKAGSTRWRTTAARSG